MRWIEVNRSNPMEGTITIPGAKNSCLALLAASCLADGKVSINSVPDISDVSVVISILRDIGADVSFHNGICTIDPKGISGSEIKQQHSSLIRTAYYFIGSLLAKFKKVTIGYPGGDNFVSRPIDQHIKGFQALGAKVAFYEDYYVVEADKLIGTDIYFDCVSCGATINTMLAAALAKGKTVLYNASKDPEVVDTAVLLNLMGARIYGAGTETIRIMGVKQLGGCEHTVVPDRLIAGAFLMCAGITDGKVTVKDIVPKHLEPCIEKLKEIGMEFSQKDNSITAWGTGNIRAARVRTGKYPMFESDFQQPITALLLKAQGRSIIADKIYPHRFNHCEQLNRMGADITVKNGVARIRSHRNLIGTWVHANDIRAGTCLMLAGLMAEKTTFITGVEHIERGYENAINDFRLLGADVKMCRNDEMASFEFSQMMMRY